jgi:hypothetical protein
VPEVAAFRCDLQASRRASSVAALARVLTAVAAAACVLAVALAPTALRGLAALTSVGAFLYSFRPRRMPTPRQLSVDNDGLVRARVDDADVSVTVQYCGPRFVSLGSPLGSLSVWPDSLAASHWRRLLVACRWPHGSPATRRTPGNAAN